MSRPIDVPGATMMHDFQLTENFVVFLDLPVVFDQALAMSPVETMPFTWEPEYGARLGVLRRDDPYGEVRWLSIDPCYIFHTLNAHDDGRAGSCCTRRGIRTRPLGASLATLWRWTIDLATGTVTEEQLDDQTAEFPRVDDRLAGQESRYGHDHGGRSRFGPAERAAALRPGDRHRRPARIRTWSACRGGRVRASGRPPRGPRLADDLRLRRRVGHQ